MNRLLSLLIVLAAIATPGLAEEQSTREQKVRRDKARVEAEGFWIYNDLNKAYSVARESGKPILVVLRCLPCEECVKLDDELVDSDPVIRPLLEKFVCVRIVGTNGLDLDVFQYDTDQSFAVFMLNADKTVYGRFGTRSHRTEWLGDVSLEGMAEALRGALALHAKFPAVADTLSGKKGSPIEFSSPEKYPSLADKFTDTLNYEGNVVKSCIHCHQIGEARRNFYWSQNKPIPEQILFPYPHPKSVGLILDPQKRATVKEVVPESVAAESGLVTGDEIVFMDGQPLLSMADVQWVLHHAPATANTIDLRVQRAGQWKDLQLELPDGWRRQDDISWRVSSWTMSRIATGGMRLEPIESDQKQSLGITGATALRVKSAGRYGPHGAARRAGFREGDIIVRFDGHDDLVREADVVAYVNVHLKAGRKVDIELVRNGKPQTLKLGIQK